MKKLIYLSALALSLCIALPAFAETMSQIWKQTTPADKMFYVAGFKDGYEVCLGITKNSLLTKEGADSGKVKSISELSQYLKADDKTIVAELDTFYSDDANANIPFHYAVIYVTQRLSGISEQDLKEGLDEMRKSALENLKEK
ncbi:MAG TPA: hypothetical protein VMD52_01295 [Patescibacteria group bacterium]|nr:hypothetical protein [Patescibacteria group bacterium]